MAKKGASNFRASGGREVILPRNDPSEKICRGHLRGGKAENVHADAFASAAQEPQQANLIKLKKTVKRLPVNSAVRKLILSEPDFLPLDTAVAKMEVFCRLLDEELEG